jgi:hypothetical protein
MATSPTTIDGILILQRSDLGVTYRRRFKLLCQCKNMDERSWAMQRVSYLIDSSGFQDAAIQTLKYLVDMCSDSHALRFDSGAFSFILFWRIFYSESTFEVNSQWPSVLIQDFQETTN